MTPEIQLNGSGSLGEGGGGSPSKNEPLQPMGSSSTSLQQSVLPRLNPSSPNKLTLLPLIFLIYFEVGGGPYGAEPAVKAAGPLLALLGFLIFPFIWSIPDSLVTAELATAIPRNGGFVLWADRAFGPFFGFLMGSWMFLSGVINSAAFPVLCADYVPRPRRPGARRRSSARRHRRRGEYPLIFPQLHGLVQNRVHGGSAGAGVADAICADVGDRPAEDPAEAVVGWREGQGLEAVLQYVILEFELLGQREHDGRGSGEAGDDVPEGAAGGGPDDGAGLPGAADGGDRGDRRSAGRVGGRLLRRRRRYAPFFAPFFFIVFFFFFRA